MFGWLTTEGTPGRLSPLFPFPSMISFSSRATEEFPAFRIPLIVLFTPESFPKNPKGQREPSQECLLSEKAQEEKPFRSGNVFSEYPLTEYLETILSNLQLNIRRTTTLNRTDAWVPSPGSPVSIRFKFFSSSPCIDSRA